MAQITLPKKFTIQDPADITKELEAGSHELMLVHSKGGHFPWCARADCLVQQLPGVKDPAIRARYRIRLSGMGNKGISRCLHVSCVESSAIDMGRYLGRSKPDSTQPYEVAGAILSFHPAVCDWVDYGGMALDANQYSKHVGSPVAKRGP